MAKKKDQKDQLVSLKEEIEKLVKKYNESIEFAEYKTMTKLDEEIKEKISEYTAEAHQRCLNEVKVLDNPMLEIAKRLTFDTITTVDKKDEDGMPTRSIEPTTKPIDPLKLHKQVTGGIGYDKKWPHLVDRLNMLFTAKSASDLGLDPVEVRNNIAMHKEAEAIKFKSEEGNPDEYLLSSIQTVVDAMVGPGYNVNGVMRNFLEKCHTKGGRNNMSVVCSTSKGMRGYMLGICHAAITGEEFSLGYKQKKK